MHSALHPQRSTTIAITTSTPPATLASDREQDMLQTMQLDVSSQPQHCSFVYLSELCVPCSDTRLRSTTRGNYIIPRTRRHLANRAFAVAAPSSWNSLPDNVRDSES